MRKTSTVCVRVEPELKEQAEAIFRRLGLSSSEAITLFFKHVILCKGLPFDVAIPNATTRRTFESTDAGQDLVPCHNTAVMFEKLGI